MEFKGTKGKWGLNHWSNGEGLKCIEKSENISLYSGDAVTENFYRIVSQIDPMRHHIQGSFEGAHIAKVIDFTHQDGGTESKANALLISKAPEMLAMLIKMHEMCKRKRFKANEQALEELIKQATEL